MFWNYNTSSSSQLEALLTKEDVTLHEVLDADDIINECRAQNKNLVDFLLRPEIIEEMVTLTTKEPSMEIEEKLRFRYPNIACELLTCDVPALNERLASDEVLLDKLYTFLECEPPLNPLLASYFSKIMGALIAKKTEQNWVSYQLTCLQVLDFLKAKDTFISLLLKHLGTSAVMDLLLKLMTEVEGVEMRQNILNWLDSQRIMQSLVSLLNPKVETGRHYNVAQLLCDFIGIARDNQRNSTERADPDPLLNTLESPETVSLLLENILGEEKVESSIVGGIQVLLALLDVYYCGFPKFSVANMYSNINDDAEIVEQRQKNIFNITQAIRTRITDLHNLLLDPPKRPPILTTVGRLEPPVGNTRIQVAKLFAAIIGTNDEELLKEFVSLGTFKVILDLFFAYPWNNFLHTQVENCLISALKSPAFEDNGENQNALHKDLLVNCKLIERILEAWKDNDEKQMAEKGIRQGYMGHLINIVNKIVELCLSTSLGQYLKDNVPETEKLLNEFKETTLSESNKLQETLLGGALPNSSNEDNNDYGGIPFPQSSALQQQIFTQYQMQNLTSKYIEGYSGFNDDAFNDGDDTLQTIDHRTDMNFDLSEGDIVQQQEIFKQVCAQNINTLDDADDQIFEDRDQTFQTVIEKQGDKNETVYSSDSDDESPRDENMDVDPWTTPKSTVLMSSDPWSATDGNTNKSNDVGGWADFSLLTCETNINSVGLSSETSSGFETTDDSKNLVAGTGQLHTSSDLNDTPTVDSAIDNTTFAGTDNVKESEIQPIHDVQLEGSEGNKSAAGDQVSEIGTEDKKNVNSPCEPSINLEGDSCTVRTMPPEKDKTEKA